MSSTNRTSWLTGTGTATATIPAGNVARAVRFLGGAGSTLIVTPAGGSAMPTITNTSASGWLELDFDIAREDFLPGTTFAFTSSAAFVVETVDIGGV
jgi:hypothetical protein